MNKSRKVEFNLLTLFTYIVSPFLACPMVLYGMFKRLKSTPFFYALLVSFVSFLYIPPIEWDKARHMDFYDFSKFLSLKEFFVINFESQPDFLFRFLLYIGANLGIRVHFVFFFVTFITVYLIFKVYFKELNRLNIAHRFTFIFVLLFIFSISYTDIISGLRYTLAISFIFYGYYIGLIDKKKSALLWLALGLITHFSVVLFVMLYFCIPFLNKAKYKWLKIGLILSMLFLLIPEQSMLVFFKSIGLGGAVDEKINSYLDKTALAEENSFAIKVINFFNIAWVFVLNIILLIKKENKKSTYVNIIIILLIATNIFVSFSVIYNRYNLFLKLFLVLFLLREYLNNNKFKTPLLFVVFLFIVYFNQIIVMRNVLIDMVSLDIEKWSFIYQIFENNFGLNDIK